ncbi:MAG: 30S ribosomal protein S9 [Candidatus Pacebacteria bacterium]|jgi:small subunit ribosomal protein S9|nr:30S ribosomal protein S9 [Candidatus Paceibacterota bacterium]
MPKKKNTTTKRKKKLPVKKKTRKKVEKKEKYIETIGRRKTSTARVRFYQNTKEKGLIVVNKKDLKEYFPELELQNEIQSPLEKTNTKLLSKGKIEILVKGGGKRGQADAIKLGISRLLVESDPKLKEVLKNYSLLTRDPRKKERKKFGLKKARKAPQFSKR